MQFIREKFDVILMTTVFVVMFSFWVYLGFPGEMRDFVVGVFSGFLTALGLRPRPATQNFNADTIERASTESGDIVGGEIQSKEKGKNEPSIS